jgi:hypothetical protein
VHVVDRASPGACRAAFTVGGALVVVARAAEDRIRRLHNLAGLLVFADSVMVRDVLANQDDVDRTLRVRSALRRCGPDGGRSTAPRRSWSLTFH